MDTWKTIQVGSVTVLVLSLGAQVWKHPGDDEGHIHQETQPGQDQQIGRTASAFDATTSREMMPFRGMADTRYIPSRKAVQYGLEEKSMPLPLRFL